jgi:hydrogenase/urease accessory protein HupE
MSRSMAGLVALLLIATMLSPARAHDLGLARISLTALGDTSIRLDAKLPVKLTPSAPIADAACQVVERDQRIHNRLHKTLSWQIECPSIITAVTLDWQREGAMLVINDDLGQPREFLVDAEKGVIRLQVPDLLQAKRQPDRGSARYLLLGIEHILAGIDHLAFVLGICLVANGWRLVKLITAFTIGHSLTLAAASLGWILIPVPPTEAVIALSVAFIAREAMLDESRRRHGFALVTLFGLLHGLGFASAVSELGLSEKSLLPALLAFNVGVELGQLLFVGLVVMTATMASRARLLEVSQIRSPLALALGSIAMFWTFDRINGFL